MHTQIVPIANSVNCHVVYAEHLFKGPLEEALNMLEAENLNVLLQKDESHFDIPIEILEKTLHRPKFTECSFYNEFFGGNI
jgi:hypothetical protein